MDNKTDDPGADDVMCHCLQVAVGRGKTAADLRPEHAEAAMTLVFRSTGSMFAAAAHVIGHLIDCGQVERLVAEAQAERDQQDMQRILDAGEGGVEGFLAELFGPGSH